MRTDFFRSPVQVVILAAGTGTRLGGAVPKPLTQLQDGRTILHRQLTTIRSVLGPDVAITAGVGYEREQVMRAAPDLRFAYNPAFASTNTSKSLLRALRNTGDDGVLWLNGDVVFSPEVLRQALPLLHDGQSFVCVDTAMVAEEEVKYTLAPDGAIEQLSKTVAGGLGEAVGINHVSAADKSILVEHLAACADSDYFERGIETAIERAGLRFLPLDITGHPAVEVDFQTDLQRANTVFYGNLALPPGLVSDTGWAIDAG